MSQKKNFFPQASAHFSIEKFKLYLGAGVLLIFNPVLQCGVWDDSWDATENKYQDQDSALLHQESFDTI